MKNLLLLVLALSSQLALAITNNQVWRIPNGGSIPSWGPINLADTVNAVTGLLPPTSLGPTNRVQASNPTGVFSTTSSSFVDVTHATVTINTVVNRPVLIYCIRQNTNDGTYPWISCGTSTSSCLFPVMRNGTDYVAGAAIDAISTAAFKVPFPVMIDPEPPAGSTTYKLRASAGSSAEAKVANCIFAALQL
jgi:hypothetical protein